MEVCVRACVCFLFLLYWLQPLPPHSNECLVQRMKAGSWWGAFVVVITMAMCCFSWIALSRLVAFLRLGIYCSSFLCFNSILFLLVSVSPSPSLTLPVLPLTPLSWLPVSHSVTGSLRSCLTPSSSWLYTCAHVYMCIQLCCFFVARWCKWCSCAFFWSWPNQADTNLIFCNRFPSQVVSSVDGPSIMLSFATSSSSCTRWQLIALPATSYHMCLTWGETEEGR